MQLLLIILMTNSFFNSDCHILENMKSVKIQKKIINEKYIFYRNSLQS